MFIKPQLGANFAQTAQPRLFDSLAIRRVASILILLSVTPTCLAFDINSYVPSGELVGSFLGPNGWRGHITQNDKGIKVILWEAPDGLVVIGKLIDKRGRDLNRLAQVKHDTNAIVISVLSKMSVSSDLIDVGDDQAHNIEAVAYEELLKLDEKNYTSIAPSHLNNALNDGGDIKEMYAFYDYQCPYCASALRHISSSGLAAKVHWLPVAILGNGSANYGAGVLDGNLDIQHMGGASRVGYPKPKKQSMDAVAHNTALLKAIQGRASTPLFLYRTPSGKVLSLAGFSEAAPSALNDMLNTD